MKKIYLFLLLIYPILISSQITSFPWNEGFENGTIPAGWSQQYVNYSVSWIVTTGSLFGDPENAHSGSYNAFFGSPDYDNKTTKLITPALNISGLSSPVLSFYHIQKPFDGDQDELRVYYKIGIAGSWILLASYTNAVNFWTAREIDLPTGISELYIAFEGKSGYGFGVCVDDISVYDQNSCVQPIGVHTIYTTTSSALLQWTPGGVENYWQIEYGLHGFSQGNGTIVQVNQLPFFLEGLAANQNYDFYIRAFCNPGYSNWTGPFSFLTICSVINSFPYNQGFESTTAPAPCWNIIYANPNPPSGNLVTHSSEFAYEGNRALKFSSVSVGTPYNQYLISPQFNFTANMNLNFRYRRKTSATEIFCVGTSVTGNNISDFSWSSDVYVTESGWKYYHVDIPSNVKYIAIQYKSILQNSLFIDALNIKNAELCYSPIDLSITNITHNSANISWIPIGNESSWIIEFGPTGFIPGSGNTISSNTASTIISGLGYSTTYDIYVYANCGVNGISVPSQKISFTTLPACYPVENFAVYSQTNNQISLSWTYNNQTSYEIEYGIEGFTLGTGTVISGLTSGNTNVSGLSPNTKYDFYIRAYCNQTSAYSDYVGPVKGKTNLCSNGCYYTFKLYDYWGDGWGNVSIKVVQNTQLTDVLSFNSGFSANFQVFICEGAEISIILNQGDFSDECGFEIYSNYNVLLYKQNFETLGSMPNQAVLFNYTATCAEPSCYPPANYNYNNLSYSSVDILWNQGNNENEWILEYGIGSYAPGTGTFIFEITQNNYHISGLTPGQPYKIYIYSNCGVNGLSTPAGPITFTTYNAPHDLDFCGLNINIPDNNFIDIIFETNGILPTTPYTQVMLKSVEFIIEHPFVADIDMFLTSPQGVMVELFSDVGGSGANFGDVSGSCSFKTELSIYPQNGSITSGTAPFNGIYQAEGNLNNFNSGASLNGLWKLRVFDDATFYTGKLQYFNLNFIETSAVIFQTDTFNESSSNDGSIENTVSVNLYNLNFANLGLLTQDVDFTVSNLPEGLICEVEVIEQDSAVIRLVGNAFSHVYDVGNVNFSFNTNAFNTQYFDLISGKIKTFSINFIALKDISLLQQNSQTVCLNGEQIHLPYSISNIGEIEILVGSQINIEVEYPIGNLLFSENTVLSENLNVGQTISGQTQNTIILNSTGDNIVKMSITLGNEDIVDNNTTEINYFAKIYNIVFPQAVNDTIIVDEFPYSIYVNVIFDPLESEEPLTYLWNGNPGTSSYDVLDVGWVYLNSSSSNCNKMDSVYIDFLNNSNSINNVLISLFPNPSKDYFTIISNININKIVITNLQGEVIISTEVNDYTYQKDVSELQPGIYFINVYNFDKLSKVGKFIKMN